MKVPREIIQCNKNTGLTKPLETVIIHSIQYKVNNISLHYGLTAISHYHISEGNTVLQTTGLHKPLKTCVFPTKGLVSD